MGKRLDNVRLIAPVKRKIKQQKIAVFDFETEDWKKAFACGLMNSEGYKLFERGPNESPDELCDRFIHHLILFCKNTLVFSHYGGKYDILLLIKAMRKRTDVETKFIISGSSIIAVILILPNGDTISLYDSFRIFQCKLADIGKAIGIEKLEIEYTNIKNEKWQEYLYTDCLILYEALSQLQNVLKEIKSVMKATAASTAMDSYLRNYLPNTFRTELDGSEWLRPFYCGGRVEVFFKGTVKKCYVYDVNSMYPGVMKKYKFPVGLPTYHTENLEKWLDECKHGNNCRYVGFFRADIKIPNHISIPTLPFKSKGKLLFPIGSFSGVWDAIELLELRDYCDSAGIDFNSIVKLHDARLFATLDLFTGYVDTFYKLKRRGGIYKIAAKLFLNSLYGKFGEGRIKKSYIMNADLDKIFQAMNFPETEGRYNLEIPELNIWSVETDRVPKHASLPIAAHVTACARVELHKYMIEAEKLGAEIYYCDTDSLFLSKPVFPMENEELGMLKFEGAWDEAIIFAPKMYALLKPIGNTKEKVRAKGFRQLKPQEFMDLIAPGGKTIKIRGGLGQFKSILNETKRLLKSDPSQVKDNLIEEPLDVWVAEIDKGIRSDYTKRIVLEDGNTLPLIMDGTNEDSWNTDIFKELRMIAHEQRPN